MKAILRFDNVDVYREGEFADTEPVTIGREPDNKVAMQLGVLSRHHAKVFFENGGWFVQDLDSANGSFFRGKEICCYDDCLTSGKSWNSFANKLESLGAVVLGAYFYGKTTYKM